MKNKKCGMTFSTLGLRLEYVCFRCKNCNFSLSSIVFKLVGVILLQAFSELVLLVFISYSKWSKLTKYDSINWLAVFCSIQPWAVFLTVIMPFFSFFDCDIGIVIDIVVHALSINRCRPINSHTRYSHYSIHFSRRSHDRPFDRFLFDLFDVICAQSLWSKPTKMPLSRLILQVELRLLQVNKSNWAFFFNSFFMVWIGNSIFDYTSLTKDSPPGALVLGAGNSQYPSNNKLTIYRTILWSGIS